MRTIGLIGGMSWESSAVYYRLVNERVRERLGGLRSAEVILWSVDFAPIAALQDAGRWDEAAAILVGVSHRVEQAGAEIVLLCTNTMHRVADAVEAAVHGTFLHIADATAESIRRAGVSDVGLLGTRFTMEADFYRGRLQSHGLRTLIPPPDDRDAVHRIIYDELCRGAIRDESRATLRGVVQRLRDRGCDGVVLGCTELPLILDDDDMPAGVTRFDTTRIHAHRAVSLALEGDSAALRPRA